MQNSECALVAHAEETTEGELEYHAAFERHEVTHVLQQKELRPIEVTVTQVARDQRILKLNKYKRYYGPGRRPLAYLLYYMPTVSPACA